MAEQLSFRLPARPALGRGDFFVSPANAGAVAIVSEDAGWPMGKLALVGPQGAGKTHLVHVWAAETGARILSAADLHAFVLSDLAAGDRVAVEDADRACGEPEAERALFHLHNLLLANGGRRPARWPVALADLRSRVAGMAVADLAPPDDPLLAAVLVKLFADRGIAVAPSLVTYLASRIDRAFSAAHDIVERLDRAALAEGRPVTRALAARLLDKPETGEA
ncbi:MAG: chromosomal replication initiator DnaA [Rhodobacteraceae bacterium]|nr:chromosomal replication initiator DnaA [Paracoccaceae bacterium]